MDSLLVYHDWLATEALTAGGIGPAEPNRLWRRHLADSLTFLAAISDHDDVVDVGSGVGLPGLPLAIALPDTGFVLLDRSQKRCQLLRRATRILDLGNVEILEGDVRQLTLPQSAAVSRSSLPLPEFFREARRLLPDGRIAVAAGSHGSGEPELSEDWEVIRIPSEILGDPGWLARVSLSA